MKKVGRYWTFSCCAFFVFFLSLSCDDSFYLLNESISPDKNYLSQIGTKGFNYWVNLYSIKKNTLICSYSIESFGTLESGIRKQGWYDQVFYVEVFGEAEYFSFTTISVNDHLKRVYLSRSELPEWAKKIVLE